MTGLDPVIFFELKIPASSAGMMKKGIRMIS
jgi:hypothetical protein